MNLNAQAQESSRYWNDFAEEYYKSFYTHVAEYPSLTLRHNYILDLVDQDSRKILEVGCGPGMMMIDLMKRGCEVAGVDIAEGMLQVARKNITRAFPQERPTLVLGDIEKLNFPDGAFDAVICAGVLEYLASDDASLNEMKRVLKPGGVLIVSVRNKLCPARAIDWFTDRLKRSKTGLNLLLGATRIFKGKHFNSIHYTPYRKHTPFKLSRSLKKTGFQPADFRYFHFYPFFAPFDKIFPGFFIKQGLRMERLCHSKWGWLASGYIAKAIKQG
jgi:ubiquinone/menaquinone biosynthesis C-methylase UbiE